MKDAANTGKVRSKRIGQAVLLLLAGLFVVLIGSVIWMLYTWPKLQADELLFQIRFLEGTGKNMTEKYVREALIPSLLVWAAAVGSMAALRRFGKDRGHRLPAVFCLVALLGALGITGYAFAKIGVASMLFREGEAIGVVEQSYVDASSVDITFPEKKKNLIILYMESIETTYADPASGGAFPENLIPGLTKLSMENQNFSGEEERLNGGVALPGSTWTIAALFGMNTGLPLRLPVEVSNRMSEMEAFFPNLLGLGDVLERENYRQYFLLGSDASFGGRKAFFKDHGDPEVIDYPAFQEMGYIPQDYYVFWGMEDEKLLAYAKEKLVEIAHDDDDTPFHLSLLTVDTHFEDGYVCPLCPDLYDEQYANVIACQDRQMTAFLEWLKQQDFYEDTTVLVVGDHPTMDRDFCNAVDEAYERRSYVTILNGPEQNTKRYYSTFDLYPTILAALGADIEGDRLGLGTNLYSTVPTLLEEIGREPLEKALRGKLSFLEDANAVSEEDLQRMTDSVLADLNYAPTCTVTAVPAAGGWDLLVHNINIANRGIEEILVEAATPAIGAAMYQGELTEEGNYLVRAQIPASEDDALRMIIRARCQDGKERILADKEEIFSALSKEETPPRYDDDCVRLQKEKDRLSIEVLPKKTPSEPNLDEEGTYLQARVFCAEDPANCQDRLLVHDEAGDLYTAEFDLQEFSEKDVTVQLYCRTWEWIQYMDTYRP